MSNFTSIDLSTLVTVTGGAANSGFFGVDRAKAGQCFLQNFPKCPQ